MQRRRALSLGGPARCSCNIRASLQGQEAQRRGVCVFREVNAKKHHDMWLYIRMVEDFTALGSKFDEGSRREMQISGTRSRLGRRPHLRVGETAASNAGQ